ncbi:phosphoserine phosphatase SerB [Vulgatibacter sp.]|uniref:phosphoserine phosphatase SerB n=1 Tax=Vulgatibacter sp. TaxID=1971226 RepID=UPI003565B193
MAAPFEEVLVTVTGRQEPALLPALTGILATCGAALLDVEQVSIRGRSLLGLLVRLPKEGRCLTELARAAAEHGVELDFEPVEAGRPAVRGRHVVTAFGASVGAPELRAVAEVIVGHGAVVESITRLAEGAFELHLALPADRDPKALRRALLELAMRSSFDVALQAEGLYRRAKRLVVFDMDSTLIRIEVIDELARAHGVVDRVAAITERAMQGEMDYDESLRQRVALLAGLDVGVLKTIASNLPLTEGAERLVRALRRLGYKVAVLSGGFSVAASALKDRLGLDEAHSNVLEVKGGKLTGAVVGRIVNAERKAELLEEIAMREGILLDQVIAVGDGANDLLMLQKAGLGIAFRAKPRLREAADLSISAAGLDAILYLLGLGERELGEIR